MADDWTLAEIVRDFVDFRDEVRDELKWLRRLLLGAMAAAILSSAISSVFVVVTR